MEITYPKYPFLWNYDDMFNEVEYTMSNLQPNHDEIIKKLSEIYPDKNIVNINQTVKLENSDKLILNTQTTYLSKLDCFESGEFNLKLITNYKIDDKKKIPVFIFDPYDNLKTEKYDPKKLCIVKDIKIIEENKDSMPILYMRTHTIKNIIRFSPSNNSKIIFKNKDDTKFYTITEFSIIMHDVKIK